MITNSDLNNWFTAHLYNDDQRKRSSVIEKSARILADIIMENTPPSADQSAAIRQLRECVMTANAAIACEE